MPGSGELTGKLLVRALNMLEVTTQILEDEGIDYILDYGTLLGIVRENRLLPWDTDIDLSIAYEDFGKFKSSLGKLRRAGFKSKTRTFKHEVGPNKIGDVRIVKLQTTFLGIFTRDDLMDVFVKKPYKDGYCYVVGVHKATLKSAPKRFLDEKTTIPFNGKEYSVPKDYKEYLAYVYGDWEKPVKDNWNYQTSDNCTIEKFHFKK